ncbi:hypothetical protein WJX74_010553 [Apatococcus lobatus]|uniref:Uncharacterized protein n=1 Tax=Apatococcus lobatus TaxID=904363 RepID=A0AAW1S5Z0_9CHLO
MGPPQQLLSPISCGASPRMQGAQLNVKSSPHIPLHDSLMASPSKAVYSTQQPTFLLASTPELLQQSAL